MPYIPPKARQDIVPILRMLPSPLKAGELTYIIYFLMIETVGRYPNFAKFAEVIGAVAQAIDEFRRRIVHPYEDEKLKENGDV
jgi:hypothetical protein